MNTQTKWFRIGLRSPGSLIWRSIDVEAMTGWDALRRIPADEHESEARVAHIYDQRPEPSPYARQVPQ